MNFGTLVIAKNIRYKEKSMKKKVFGLFLITATLCGNVLPVFAAELEDTFDAAYYAEMNPDVVAVYGNDEQALYNHYITEGLADGRQGCATFNLAEYKNAYADLQAAFGDDWNAYAIHYYTMGINEGRTAGVYDTTLQTQTPVNEEKSYAEQVVALVNEYRAKEGLSALTLDNSIATAAQTRAVELESLFSHTRPDGRSCFTALNDIGFSYWEAGENIAAGQTTPEQVMDSWMNSPGHRANILKSSYTKIGVGYYLSPNGGYSHYWVQLFAN